MKRGSKGSITIYLAMVFSIMIALIFTLVEDVRAQAVRMSLECAMDLSLYSIFAEYHRELLEQYDLFFIDTGYGDTPSIDNTQQHLKGYMKDNFTFKLDEKGLVLCDFLKMEVEQAKICSYTRATDEAGAVFKRQAVAYMKDQTGLSYLQKWTNQMEVVKENQLLTRDITAERTAIEQEIDSIQIPKEKVSEEEYREVPLENPADKINATRSAGILHLVIDDTSSISSEIVDVATYVSHRDVRKGYGLLERKKASAVEDLLYHEYILNKCGNYTDPLEKGQLKYQTEYILAGKENDMDNLKWVVNRLLLLREVSNVTYIYTDSTKMMEAELLALGLAAVVKQPDLVEPVKNSILFAWAYVESVYDVKQLLAGEKVPLMKERGNWHYSLSGMLGFGNGPGRKADNDKSTGEFAEKVVDQGVSNQLELSYKDYLRILLTTLPEKDSVFRMMDIVEMDIRKTTGNVNFSMDGCVDYIDAKVYGSSGFGTVLEIRRSYCFF